MLVIYRTLDDEWYNDFVQGAPTPVQVRKNISDGIPRESAQIKSTRSFALYETILMAATNQRRGDWTESVSLVREVMQNKSDVPGDVEIPLTVLEAYADAVMNGLASTHQVDMDALINRIELTSAWSNAD